MTNATRSTRDTGARGRLPPREQPATLVVVQAGTYPVDGELVERLLRGDEVGAEARASGSRSVDVGERIAIDKLHPAVVRSLIANRLAVPDDVAAETNAALRAEYGEWQEGPPGVHTGVKVLAGAPPVLVPAAVEPPEPEPPTQPEPIDPPEWEV